MPRKILFNNTNVAASCHVNTVKPQGYVCPVLCGLYLLIVMTPTDNKMNGAQAMQLQPEQDGHVCLCTEGHDSPSFATGSRPQRYGEGVLSSHSQEQQLSLVAPQTSPLTPDAVVGRDSQLLPVEARTTRSVTRGLELPLYDKHVAGSDIGLTRYVPIDRHHTDL